MSIRGMLRGVVWCLVVVGVRLSAPLFAQAPVVSGDSSARLRIIGIYDVRTGEPIPGVVVREVFSGASVITTAHGLARLDFVVYRGQATVIELQKLGYEAKQIVLSRGDTNSVTEVLEPATTLAPVVTTEKFQITRDAGLYEGFAMRCQEKLVTCFDPAEIAKHPVANIADLLIKSFGVTMGACGSSPTGKASDTRHGLCNSIAMHPSVIPPAYCFPNIFIDGYLWNTTNGLPIDSRPGGAPNASFTASNVKAIEVYPSEKPRPMRFVGGDETCGAVVIWTK
ncbi:MAG TPA: hypothetical protein VGM82_19970 [Gemmatimonadaceae bacterium]|jgi:hypothetical protein